MEATGPKMASIGVPETGLLEESVYGHPRRLSVHPCENCKCCSCKNVCTMCNRNCCPADSHFVPVIACPDFVPMQETTPVRYTYRTGYDFEFRLHLPGSR